MRKIICSLIATGAAFCSNVFAFDTGAPLTPDALLKADRIQGEIPASWEPGKVYIVECWTTWCGPCVKAIPHLNALHENYTAKGLRVIGVNLSESKEKAASFVKEKGDGMSYPVVAPGELYNSAFQKQWAEPGCVREIPFSFVIKDGKFLFSATPEQLTNEVVEALLSGGEKQDQMVKSLAKIETDEQRKGSLMSAINRAELAGDHGEMASVLGKLEKLNPATPELAEMLPRIRNQIMVMRKDWPGLEKEVSTAAPQKWMFSLVGQLDVREGVPGSLYTALIKKLDAFSPLPQESSYYIELSRCQWLCGNKESSKTNAHKALDCHNSKRDEKREGFEKYAAAVDAGRGMTLAEVFTGK